MSPDTTKEPLAVHNDELEVVSDSESSEWKQGEALEAEVFIEAGYVETQDELAHEYAKYLPNTEFVVAKRDGQVGGSIRVIKYDPSTGFKTLDDIGSGKLPISDEGHRLVQETDLSSSIEIGTLAVRKDLRRQPGESDKLAVVLYGAIWHLNQEYDCPYIFASFDEKFFERFQAIFGPAAKALGPAIDYMGSPTIPALLYAPDLVHYAELHFPPIYEMMIESIDKIKS